MGPTAASESGVSLDDDARRRVVAAADALFHGRGIEAVGVVDEVRSVAGVSLKRLYALFPGKEQLVLAVLDARHRLWQEGRDAAADAGTPRDRLLAVDDYLGRWFTDDPFRGCGSFTVFGELGATWPAVAETARAHKDAFQRYVSRLTEAAGGDADLAAQLALLAEGARTTAAISGRPDAVRQARRAAQVLIEVALDDHETAPEGSSNR